MNSKTIKERVIELGADLCGVASHERFAETPKGFSPLNIVENGGSFIVFAKRMPEELLFEESHNRYYQINNQITREVDEIAMLCASELTKKGIKSVPILFDSSGNPGSNFSLKYAAYLAGLGVIGKNTLLLNKNFGNMINIGAVVVDLELESDLLADYQGCPNECNLCVQACPRQALDGKKVNSSRCKPVIEYKSESGVFLKKCSICRRVCPCSFGIKD